MNVKKVYGFNYVVGCQGESDSTCIYYLGLPQELSGVEKLIEQLGCTIVYIVITLNEWDDLLSPWSAPGLYRNDPDFIGGAPEFLDKLTHELIPAIEKAEGISPRRRAIAGYSMAGLFSVYAFANCSTFEGVASMSGSFWYQGWVDYVESLDLDKNGCGAFFSLGDREHKAREKILRSVRDDTDITIRALESWGVKVQHHLVPGGHFDNIYTRVDEGLTTLVEMLQS